MHINIKDKAIDNIFKALNEHKFLADLQLQFESLENQKVLVQAVEKRRAEIVEITQKEKELRAVGGECAHFIGVDCSKTAASVIMSDYVVDWTVFYTTYFDIRLKPLQYKDPFADSSISEKYYLDNCDININEWLAEQRRRFSHYCYEYDKININTRNFLTPHQYICLERLNIDWIKPIVIKSSPWEKMFMSLKDFKKQHGHCFVPNKYKDTKLRFWTIRMRQLYNDRKLSPNRIKLLESIGFNWNIDLDKIFKMGNITEENVTVSLSDIDISTSTVKSLPKSIKDKLISDITFEILIQGHLPVVLLETSEGQKYKIIDGEKRIKARILSGQEDITNCTILHREPFSEIDLKNIDQLIHSLDLYKKHLLEAEKVHDYEDKISSRLEDQCDYLVNELLVTKDSIMSCLHKYEARIRDLKNEDRLTNSTYKYNSLDELMDKNRQLVKLYTDLQKLSSRFETPEGRDRSAIDSARIRLSRANAQLKDNEFYINNNLDDSKISNLDKQRLISRKTKELNNE